MRKNDEECPDCGGWGLIETLPDGYPEPCPRCSPDLHAFLHPAVGPPPAS